MHARFILFALAAISSACVDLAPPTFGCQTTCALPDATDDTEIPAKQDAGTTTKPDLGESIDGAVDLVDAPPVDQKSDSAPLRAENGASCVADQECTSGFCTSGVCCNEHCDGECKSCTALGQVGVCTFAPAGTPAPTQCQVQPASTCGNDGTCDGAGGCRRYPTGTACAGTCTNNQAVSRVCEGAGICTDAMTTSCGSFSCGATSCLTQCDNSTQCSNGTICANGLCGGIVGEYFSGASLEPLKLTRMDPNVAFDWGDGAPDGALAVDGFSVRWTGVLIPRYSETYTFYATSDDGARLWVNHQLVTDDWNIHPMSERTGTVTLVAGQSYDLRFEYFDAVGAAVASLAWSSMSQAKEFIPTGQLAPYAVPFRSYEAERDLAHAIGGTDGIGWSAAAGASPGQYLVSGPDATDWGDRLVDVAFRVMIDPVGTGAIPFKVDIWDNTTQETLAQRSVSQSEFGLARVYTNIMLRADLTGRSGHAMEARVLFNGETYVNIDKIMVGNAVR